jgi:hypothetical protein
MAKKRAPLDDSVPRDKHGEEIKVGQKVEVQCFLNAGSLAPAPGEVLALNDEGVRILVTLNRPAPIGPPFNPGESFEYTVPSVYAPVLIRICWESLDKTSQ